MRVGDSGSEQQRLEGFVDAFVLLGESMPHQLLLGRGYSYIAMVPTTMNQYLDVLIAFGLVGIFCFILLIGVATLRLRSLHRIRPNIAAYGLGMLSFSLVFFLMLAPLSGIFHMSAFVFYFSMFIAFSRFSRAEVTPVGSATGAIDGSGRAVGGADRRDGSGL